MTRKIKFEFVLSGFIIALILVSLFATTFGVFLTQMQNEYNTGGNNSFLAYNQTEDILSTTNQIRNATDIEQEQGVLDVIGGFFSAGYAAIKVAFQSFNLFDSLINDAANDLEVISFIKTYLVSIIMVCIFVGIGITVLVKMRS